MAQTQPASSTDVGFNPTPQALSETARTVRRGPNVSTTPFGRVWAVAATSEKLLELGMGILLQPEDGGVATPPDLPEAFLTSDGKLATVDRVCGLQIFEDNYAQHVLPHNPALANPFFARHAKLH